MFFSDDGHNLMECKLLLQTGKRQKDTCFDFTSYFPQTFKDTFFLYNCLKAGSIR